MVCIEQSMKINAPIQRCFDLSRSIEVHLLGTEESGESWQLRANYRNTDFLETSPMATVLNGFIGDFATNKRFSSQERRYRN